MALTITVEGTGVIANSDGLTDSAGGSWGEDGGGSISLSTETYKYGSSCVAGAYSKKSGFHYYDRGAGSALNFGTGGAQEGEFIYLWIFNPTPSLNETKANNGLRIRLGTDLSNYREFLILSSDDWNDWDGSWKCFVLDPTKTGSWADTGTYNTGSIRYMGVYVDAVALAKGDNIFISQIAVGKGLRVTGTSIQGWQDLVDYCTDYTNRAWGMIEQRGSSIFVKGKIYIGSTSQTAITDFSDSGRLIQFEKSEYWNGTAWVSSLPVDACGIIVEDAASYATTFTDGVIVGTDNGRSGSSISGNDNENVIIDFSGLTNAASLIELYNTSFGAIYGAITFKNDSDHKYLGCAFIDCSQVNPVGAPLMRNCIFAETADVDAALLWNENINIENSKFIANTTGAAIEMPSAVGTPYDFSSLTFSGNTYDVLNSSGSAITINKLAGTNASTSEGSSATFTANFAHIIEGLELNTSVTYVAAGTSTELYHVENASVSDGNGKYKTSYTHGGGADVDILIFHVDYQPDISNIYGLTLPSSDAIVKVQMFEDDNYYNPV